MEPTAKAHGGRWAGTVAAPESSPGAKPDDCATGVGSIRTPGSNAEIYSSLRGVSQISLGSQDPDELT